MLRGTASKKSKPLREDNQANLASKQQERTLTGLPINATARVARSVVAVPSVAGKDKQECDDREVKEPQDTTKDRSGYRQKQCKILLLSER